MAGGGCVRPCVALAAAWVMGAVLYTGGWMTFRGLVVTVPGGAAAAGRSAAAIANSSRKLPASDPAAQASRDVAGLYPLVQRGSNPVYLQGLGGAPGVPGASSLGSAAISLLAGRRRARGAASPWIVAPVRVSEGSGDRVWALLRLSGEDQAFVQPRPNADSPDSGRAAWCCGPGSPAVAVFGPEGTAAAAAPSQGGKRSPLDDVTAALAGRPVDCAVMALCAWLYFRQSSGKIRVDDVAISARSAVGDGQGWRALTSAVSHGSLMHVGFNLMTLYQLRPVEPGLGSLRHAATLLALAAATSAVACALQLCAYRLCRRAAGVEQRAVGYSAVLFSLVVVSASLQGSFCPVPFLPWLCLPTWTVALPWGSSVPGIPGVLAVNLAPFVMLVFMQVVVPNASFAGHLAGILVGYPLAWGLLDWVPAPAGLAGAVPLLLGWGAECLVAAWGFPPAGGGGGGGGGRGRGALPPVGWTPRSVLMALPGVAASRARREAEAAAEAAETSALALLATSALGLVARRWSDVAWDVSLALLAVSLLPAAWRLTRPPLEEGDGLDPADDAAGGAAPLSPVRALAAGLTPWRRAAALLSGETAATSLAWLAALLALEATGSAIACVVLRAPLGALAGGSAAVWGGFALSLASLASSASLTVASLRLLGWANASGPLHIGRCAWAALGSPEGTASLGGADLARDGASLRDGLPAVSCGLGCPLGRGRAGGAGGAAMAAGGGEGGAERQRLAGGDGGAFQGRGLTLSGRPAGQP